MKMIRAKFPTWLEKEWKKPGKIDRFLGGKWVRERINGKLEWVLLPPRTGPSEKEMERIFKRIANRINKIKQ